MGELRCARDKEDQGHGKMQALNWCVAEIAFAPSRFPVLELAVPGKG